MKVAFYPGCVSKGACPELYVSAKAIAEPLGLELNELDSAPCTGAGVLSEQNPQLADALNGLTLAMAESEGADLMTICSTCQGVLSNHNYHFKQDKERMDRANATIGDQGFRYSGTTKVKHLLWMLFEDIGIDRSQRRNQTKAHRAENRAVLRLLHFSPEESLGLRNVPSAKPIWSGSSPCVGAEPVEYRGSTKCCGFPMLTFNRDKALAMGGNHIIEAKDKGADLLVTPCPLCHLNLDGQQPDAARVLKKDIGVPIFHLPQLLGLAFGMDPAELRLDHHVVSTKGALEKVELKV